MMNRPARRIIINDRDDNNGDVTPRKFRAEVGVAVLRFAVSLRRGDGHRTND